MQEPNAEEAELERVLARLSAINDEARLEQVLFGLVPKLIERLETCTNANAKKLLIEIFSHVTRWVKPPARVKIPIQEIANVISSKCAKESQALRVGMMLIDIGFERAEDEVKLETVRILLNASEKLVDSQPQLVRLTFAVLFKLDLSTVERHVIWIADVCLDCCYPVDFFPAGQVKSTRLQMPPFGRQARSLDDNSSRALDALSFLLWLTEKHDHPKLKANVYPYALASSVLCATSSYRDAVRNAGEEGVRRLRDVKTEDPDQKDEVLNSLFSLILGDSTRARAPPAARIKAMELLGKVGISGKSLDKLVKTLVAGMFGKDQTVPLRIQTLQLLNQTSNDFPLQYPAETLISSALKQQLQGNVLDDLTNDHRTALFLALSSWIASRRRPNTQASAQSIWNAEFATKIMSVLSEEYHPDAIAAEYQALCTITDDLVDVTDMATSQILLDSVEFGGKPSSGKLKSLALHLSSRVIMQWIERDHADTNGPFSIDSDSLLSSCWIVLLSSRSSEPRENREAAQKLLNRIILRLKLESSSRNSFFSFDTLLDFVEAREQAWDDSKKDYPREYFYPTCLKLLTSPEFLSTASDKALDRFVTPRGRLANGLTSFPQDGDYETKSLSANCLAELLSSNRANMEQVGNGLFDPSITSPLSWLGKHLASPNEQLRRSCARLCRYFYAKWPTEIDSIVVGRLKHYQGAMFSECHGALCAAGQIGILSPLIVPALTEWVLDNANRANNENRELRNEAFASLRTISVESTATRSSKTTVTIRYQELLEKAKEIMRNKTSGDDLEGLILFLGCCASLRTSAPNAQQQDETPRQVGTSSMDNNSINDVAFQLLLKISSDTRFGLGSQQVIGKSFADLPDDKLVQVIREILEKSIFEESSQKSKSSAAILLEQIVKSKILIKKEGIRIRQLMLLDKQQFSAGDHLLIDDLEDGLIYLLGEAEEYTRLCACRALADLFFAYNNASEDKRDVAVRERLTLNLIRKLSFMAGDAVKVAVSEAQAAAQAAAHAMGRSTTTGNNNQRGTASATGNNNANEASSESATNGPLGEPDARRPRLGGRRGNEQRLWAFQDLAMAAQQSGNASLLFSFLAICGDPHRFAAAAASQEDSTTGDVVRAAATEESTSSMMIDFWSVFKQSLKMVPLPRLATQFMRRRHFSTEELTYKVAAQVWNARLQYENVFENLPVLSSIWNDSVRLLRDSFLAKERRSACLTLSEIATKLDDDREFVCSLEDAWRSVFRSLDDLDESVSQGPALAFGRAIKRRTLKALQQQQQQRQPPALTESAEQHLETISLFQFLLNSGLSHPVKQVRDLTRSFLVDSISQKKLPDEFVCQVCEALLRTIGESESLTLQYAQFHTRGNGGTGELNVESSKLEEIRARLALESPEYHAALKCASRLDQVKICHELVQVVSKVIRTGVGLVTLVAAVSLSGFLASEEWPMSRVVMKGDETLLKALGLKFMGDPSVELRKRIASSAAMVARVAAPQTIAEYCSQISQSYDSDPETSVANRSLAAQASVELVRRQVLHENLVRPCFLGRFDEEKSVAELWKQSWEGGLNNVLSQEELINISGAAINAYSYRTRRQGAEGILSLPLFAVEKACHGQIGLDMLRLSTNSALWEGKETICKATGSVFAVCSEPDLAEYACTQFEDALLKVPKVEVPLVEQSSGHVVEARPKWLWESMFEAERKILTNPLVSQQSKERFLMRWAQAFETEVIPKEALVQSAALRCAKQAFVMAGSTTVSAAIAISCVRIVNSVLSSSPSWNVKVASFEVLQASSSAWLGMELSKQQQFSELIKEILAHVAKTIAEEKKPTVLISVLELAKSLTTVDSSAFSDLLIDFKSSIQPSLVRLESNADPAVGKVAHEIRSISLVANSKA